MVSCLATDATYTADTPGNYVFPQQPLKGKVSTSNNKAWSHRSLDLQHLRAPQPALQTMTSLPAPERSAQMLVIEVGKKEMIKRKGSMTDLFRKLSRSTSKQRMFSRKGQQLLLT